MKTELITKNGLLYRYLSVHEADEEAKKQGFAYAEQLVKHLEKSADTEATKEADPEMVSFDWKCPKCGDVINITYAELATGSPPTCSLCDEKLEMIREI